MISGERSIFKPNIRRLGSLAVIIFIAIILFVWRSNYKFSPKDDFKAFREAHNNAKIIGKTEDEIVQMYGNPFNIDRLYGGEVELITYVKPGNWYYCYISLKNGVAVRVSFAGMGIPPGPKYLE